MDNTFILRLILPKQKLIKLSIIFKCFDLIR